MTAELIEIYHISHKHHDYVELDRLHFLNKNLYNSTLYTVRQHYFQTKYYLNYNQENLTFTHENQQDYRALPAKVTK